MTDSEKESIARLKEREQKRESIPPSPPAGRVPARQRRRSHRSNPSFLGPLLLIAAGTYFLLNNLGIAPTLNWGAVFRLWPLLLILIGVNIIVRQAPQPLGAFLSGIVGLVAVGIFGAVLFFSDSIPFVSDWVGDSARVTVQETTVDLGHGAVEAAVEINFSSAPATVSALSDSEAVLAGRVTYLDEVDIRANDGDASADIYLGTDDNRFFLFSPPFAFRQDDAWSLGLNPDVPLDLTLDLSSGAADLDLDELTLTELEVDVSSGAATLSLPAGRYNTAIFGSSGKLDLMLAADGDSDLNVEIDMSSGALDLYLPPGVAVYLVFDARSGRISVPDGWTNVAQDEDVVTWVTGPDVDEATVPISLFIDGSSGAVNVRTER